MISVSDALEKILTTTPRPSVEFRPISKTVGDTLAQDIIASRDQPPFNRVTMDGIAIQLQETSLQSEYLIEGIQAAGSPQLKLQNQINCLEVMTGATLPLNTNCVIPYEQIEIKNSRAYLQISGPNLMQNIHLHGSDYKKNDLLIKAGVKITSAVNAVIASQGLKNVKVHQNPQITIISTGSELVEPGEEVQSHQIFMSNSYAIEHELRSMGQDKVKRVHICDDQAQTQEQIERYLDESDILILTGGVSRGKFDFVPQALENLGVTKHFHKIAQRPGKPMWYGTKDVKQVFALPGNPASCLTCLLRYVVPSLVLRKGQIPSNKKMGILTMDVEFKNNMTYFCPVKVTSATNGSTQITPLATNGSGDFYSLGLSDGFVELPAEQSTFSAGSAYQYFEWS